MTTASRVAGCLVSVLVMGVPTRVSFKGEKGADFGYIHPVTWALRSFAEAALRYSQQIPQIDPEWVNSEENAEITRTRIFLGGKVISAFAAQAVDRADVLFHRTDRTLDQIIELDKERAQIRRALGIRALLDRGLSAAQIAQVRKLTIEEVRQLTNVELDEGAWSADLQRYFRGEFFYDFDKTRPDGFFLVAVPRKQQVQAVVAAKGFRQIRTEIASGDGLFADVGSLQIFPPLLISPKPPQL